MGHDHAFLKKSPEKSCAVVKAARGSDPLVTSSIRGMVVLKTTQSGFEGFHKVSSASGWLRTACSVVFAPNSRIKGGTPTRRFTRTSSSCALRTSSRYCQTAMTAASPPSSRPSGPTPATTSTLPARAQPSATKLSRCESHAGSARERHDLCAGFHYTMSTPCLALSHVCSSLLGCFSSQMLPFFLCRACSGRWREACSVRVSRPQSTTPPAAPSPR